MQTRLENRVASERRKALRAEEAKWIDIATALEIEGTDNPANLFAALASGKVQARWQRPSRWWQWTHVPPRLWDVARISRNAVIGPNGTSLEGEHQVFRLNENHWREYLDLSKSEPVAERSEPIEVKPPASTSPAERTAETSAVTAELVPDAAPPPSEAEPIGRKGGRPTDKERIIAEAIRQARDGFPKRAPVSKAAWAEQLLRWNKTQGDPIHLRSETIAGWPEITRFWAEIKKSR